MMWQEKHVSCIKYGILSRFLGRNFVLGLFTCTLYNPKSSLEFSLIVIFKEDKLVVEQR